MTDLFGAVVRTSVILSPIIAVLLLLNSQIDRRYQAKGKCVIWVLIAVRMLLLFSADAQQAPVAIVLPGKVDELVRSLSSTDRTTGSSGQTAEMVTWAAAVGSRFLALQK